MSSANQLPAAMTVAQFLAWRPPGNPDRWELIDGAPRAMSPSSPRHGLIQSETARLISNHLAPHPRCRIATEPGVQPRVGADANVRAPDLAVTCSPIDPADRLLPQPVLIIEILSPSNRAETWMNVWSYVTIPSVMEILILHTAETRADLLRRQSDGTWPDNPVMVTAGDVKLESVDFAAPLAAFYRTA